MYTPFSLVRTKIVDWAKEKEILAKATPFDQLGKMKEEVEELSEALKGQSRPEIVLELGDVGVTWIIQCEMNNVSPVVALVEAYRKISRRKGAMVGGVFVKAEDMVSEDLLDATNCD